MPLRGAKERIEDILDSIDAIFTYTEGMAEKDFMQDRRTIRAVSFEFVVIGEAVANLPRNLRELHPQLPWQELNAVRNYAVHEYFRLSAQILWTIISQELPSVRD